ncbi:MAG: hypothetical protein B6I20_10065 [Bacteroidetes bacterium 4572_117]|nr:MAG: hypothetical protein B6I20_10065 [Bacteroidetes bacterium 4572_117]
MKKLFSILSFVLFAGFVSVNAQSNDFLAQNSTDMQKNESVKTLKTNKVKVYYFHATRRCATCQAVEAVTEKAIKEYYGKKVPFKSINREINQNNPLVKKYKISGQTLLIISGDKVVNLTNDAFMYARTNPDKLKAKIKKTIDSMM